MTISEKEVRHIARLARLHISDEEVRLYQGQLEKILDSMQELRSAKTEGVTPGSAVLGPTVEMRDDEVNACEDVESLLSQSPEREGPYFKVRKVIE